MRLHWRESKPLVTFLGPERPHDRFRPDDTSHFLSECIKGRRKGLAASEAKRSASEPVGHAARAATAVPAAGFPGVRVVGT